MYGAVKDELAATLKEIQEAGLYKRERELTTPQSSHVATTSGEALNFCANNYLGFADHPEVVAASREALDTWGFGMASVRFICGTQSQHTLLESASRSSSARRRRSSSAPASTPTAACSRCCSARTTRSSPTSSTTPRSSTASGSRRRRGSATGTRTWPTCAASSRRPAWWARRVCVVTDGVFSMDGSFAPLDEICDLAEEFDAMVLVDDSHAVGFVGDAGRGTPELFGVLDRVDIVTGTLGKALGGASGGYVASHREVVDLLRQRSRPYLFSNSVAPAVVAGSLKALELVSGSSDAREMLRANAALFRELMTDAGFALLPGAHAITPVMFPGDDGARRAAEIADHMFGNGVYVIAFSFPVVPRGRARIRVQLSAAHSEADVRTCVDAFVAARDAVG